MFRTAPFTLDSNTLIYAADPDDPERQSSAIDLIQQAAGSTGFGGVFSRDDPEAVIAARRGGPLCRRLDHHLSNSRGAWTR
jgi:hypothetical protein